ncbi:MAG: Gfo/Idh/MocA family oxidoreductase [Pleurocapsa minor GSE-CHR-MK-17-07R]|jgi:predicted dehydrogenase|nr:Gfo/Idh/MocA family oxidoreductase [Pleurocapsa minor GSE-CHR-MK 17-07R]
MRLGIVGPSLIWDKRHYPALQALTDTFTVTAFCAASDRRKAAVAEQYPGVPYMTDYDAFLRRDDIDAVVMLTPIALNGPLSQQALEAGKDVFLEKPMAHTLEIGQKLVRTSKDLGRRLWILEQDAFDPRYPLIRDILASGEIGDPVYFDYVFHFTFDDGENNGGGYGLTTWRQQPEFPIGMLLDGGHHNIAALACIFGPPTSIFATGIKLREGFGEFDQLTAHFMYDGRLRGAFSHAAYLSNKRNLFDIHCTRGILTVEWEQLIVTPAEGETRIIPLAQANTHDIMWGQFAQRVKSGGDVDYPADAALADLTTLFAIRESAVSGHVIALGGL